MADIVSVWRMILFASIVPIEQEMARTVANHDPCRIREGIISPLASHRLL